MNVSYRIGLFAFLLLISLPATKAQDSLRKMEWSGYQKLLNILQSDPVTKDHHNINFLHNRIQWEFYPHAAWKIKLHARTRFFFGESLLINTGLQNSLKDASPLLNLSFNWLNENALLANTQLDRASLEWGNDKVQISLGRQRVNWGIHNIWNPNDLFNAYNLLDFDYEERPGSDLVRLRWDPGWNSRWELAYQPARKINQAIGAVRYSWNQALYDFQVVAGQYRSDLVIGAGWAGSLGQTGFKGEMSWFIPGIIAKSHLKNNLSIAWMSDYSWGNAWYGSVAALYQSAPQASIPGIPVTGSGSLSPRNLSPFRWTFYTGLSKVLADRWSLNGSALYGPWDKAVILLPSVGFDISERMDADLTAQLFWYKPADELIHLTNAYYLRCKYSF
jgi:hypothetical protein